MIGESLHGPEAIFKGIETSNFKNEEDSPNPESEFDFSEEISESLILVIDEAGNLSEILADLPDSKDVADIKQLVNETRDGIMKKISECLGSNEGGWYEDADSGDKYYVKFYKNEAQARVEYIANAIYSELGINAAQSELFEMNNKLAIRSKEVAGAENVEKQTLKQSPDVKKGFVADAFLANWDVVGLVYDNIVRDTDGKMNRIDNGGTMIFRAQGGSKDFSPNTIPELDTLRNPNYTAGQIFTDITNRDIQIQANELVSRLTDEKIELILANSGLKGNPDLKQIFEYFEGKEKIGISPETGLRESIGLLSDGNKIENQQMNIIDARDENKYEINFKLTSEHLEKVIENLNNLKREFQTSFDIGKGNIIYGSKANGEDSENFHASQSVRVTFDGITVDISTAEKYRVIAHEKQRAMQGLVRISIDSNQSQNFQELNDRLQEIFSDILKVDTALQHPTSEDEDNLKAERYIWQKKLSEFTPSEAELELIKNKMSREEVFPNYKTIVENGKGDQLQKEKGDYTLFHEVGSTDTIAKSLKPAGYFQLTNGTNVV